MKNLLKLRQGYDIKNIKNKLMKEPIVLKSFEKYGISPEQIQNLSISFKPLDVSAKTVNGKIILNINMLEDSFEDYFSYAVHEVTHYLQHMTKTRKELMTGDKYLDNENEVEAFKNQVKYKSKTEPRKKIEKYLKRLFDKHNLSKDERKRKKEELLNND